MLPVVVLTALDADDEIARAFEAGADDFVRKPFRAGRARRPHSRPAPPPRRRWTSSSARSATRRSSSSSRRRWRRTSTSAASSSPSSSASPRWRASTACRSSSCARRGDVGYVVAASDDETPARPAHRSRASTPRSSRCSRAASRSSSPTRRPTRSSRSSATTRTRARSARSPSSPSSTRGARWACSSSARSRRVRLRRSASSPSAAPSSNAMAIALRNARVLQSLRDQTQQVTVARFEAERRLRTLQRYADFFESSADGIVVIDAEGRLLFSNPRARAITGYAEAELRGRARRRPLPRTRTPRRAHELRVGFARGPLSRRASTSGCSARTASVIILSVNFNSVLREEGVVLCSFRDVTARAGGRARALKTKDFLQRVIDSSVDAIISADMHGRVLLFNRAAERIYGMTAAEMIGARRPQALPRGSGARQIMRAMRAGRRPGRGATHGDPRRQRRARPGARSPPRSSTRRTARRERRHLHRSCARRCGWSSASRRRRSRSSRRSGRRSSPSSPAPPRTSSISR